MWENREQIYQWVFQDEGPYSYHPADNGGMTTWGITADEVRRWTGKPVSREVMQNLTQGTAKEIYTKWYWTPLRCDQLATGVDYIVFDAGLLHGIVRSTKWLQHVVGARQDGQLGPKTLEAAEKRQPIEIVNAITELRRRRAKDHPDSRHFYKGWSNRITRVRMRCAKLLGEKPASDS